MSRQSCLGMVCGALLMLSTTAAPASALQATEAAKQAPAGAAEAVKASPDLVNALSKELGSTPEQAAGAAGALFGVAKSRLNADEFSQVAKAVPGMNALLGAAPALSGAGGAIGTAGAGAISQLGGSASGLAAAASAFTKLGLKPEMVSKAVPVLTSFVSKSGGAGVGSLLAGVLK